MPDNTGFKSIHTMNKSSIPPKVQEAIEQLIGKGLRLSAGSWIDFDSRTHCVSSVETLTMLPHWQH